MRLLIRVGVAACVLGGAAQAQAQAQAQSGGTLLLVYRAEAPLGCPSEPVLRAAVAAELGRDPFVADGPEVERLVVEIRRVHERVVGRIQLHSAAGHRLGTRKLRGGTCSELVPVLALAIAVAVDPLHVGGPHRATAPQSTPAGATESAAAGQPGASGSASDPALLSGVPSVDEEPFEDLSSAPPIEEPAASTSALAQEADPAGRAQNRGLSALKVNVAFGAEGAIDLAPGPTWGVSGRMIVAASRWLTSLELHVDLPGRAVLPGGSVSASTLAFFFVPCALHRGIALCGVIAAGGQELSGSGFDGYPTLSKPFIALGGRLEVGLPLGRYLALLLRTDLLVPLTRTELYSGPSETRQLFYRSSPIASEFGMALSTR